jgi:hypothetical protein
VPDFIIPIFWAFIRCMLQPPMSPFDIDVLAIPISLFIIILFGLSAIIPVILLTFIIPSPEQVIIFADAGVIAKAAARVATATRYFMSELSLEKTGRFTGLSRYVCSPQVFRVEKVFRVEQVFRAEEYFVRPAGIGAAAS